MIEFTGPDRKEVCLAIQSAFNRAALEQVVSFELNQDLESIVSGCNDSEVTFKLVCWSEAQGCVVQLLQAVCLDKPDNPRIRAIAEKFLQRSGREQGVAQPRPRFPEPCEFDLAGVMEDALTHLYGQRGLVGFVVPCVEEAFQVRFCERLKRELGRKNIKIRQPLQLNPYVSIDQIVKRVQQYERDLLRDYDVVCPMPISIFEPDSTIPDELWRKLSDSFRQTPAKRRLILFLYGHENAVFPEGLHRIRSPEFRAVHVFRWVVRMAKAMDWQEYIWEQWQEHMMEGCCSDDASDALDIRLAYEHLDMSISLLQRQLPPEQFIQELRSGF